jgi:thiaminase
MEKLVIKGKKAIRLLLVESLHQTVHAIGLNKSKKKTEKVINKAAKRIAELVADQMKRELKEIKEVKVKNDETPKAKKVKKIKKVKKMKEA